MVKLLICPQGHQWRPADDSLTPGIEPTEACPVCGSGGVAERHGGMSLASRAWLVVFALIASYIAIELAGFLGVHPWTSLWRILPFGVAFVAGLAWLGWYLKHKRTQAMAEICQAMKFAFQAKVTKNELKGFSGPALFSKGSIPLAGNLMRGKAGDLDVALMDFSYSVGAGQHQHRVQQTVVIFQPVRLPRFQLYRETFMHKIGQLFGFQDINFAENPTFSRKYLLRGTNESAIRAVFLPEVLDFFADNLGWTVETGDGRLAIYRGGKCCKPADCPALLGDALRIVDLLAPSE
jgi:hypothetical protein